MTAPGKVVVDASVVVKWYVPEAGSEKAAAILDGGDQKLAPDLLVAEFGNVLWKKVRKGELDISEANEMVNAFVVACPVTLEPSSLFLEAAFDIATRRQRTVYDSLYLAVALAEGCSLLTADERLAAALRGTELEQTVRLL